MDNNLELLQICKLTSCIAGKKFSYLEKHLLISKKNSVNSSKIYEAFLQCYLFCGFPAALESIKLFKNVFTTFKTKENKYDIQRFKKTGTDNCKVIYRKNYRKLVKNVDNLSKDLGSWMIIEGYGKVMGRPGLNLFERECINVSILCTNYYPVQLHSHLRGAMNTGAEKEFLKRIITNTSLFNTEENISLALALLSKAV